MDIFEVLADPTRRQLLGRLAQRPRSVSELVETFPSLTQPAISRHLRVLREAGIVEVRPDAQRRIYALRFDCFAKVDDWLEGCRLEWSRWAEGENMTGSVDNPRSTGVHRDQ